MNDTTSRGPSVGRPLEGRAGLVTGGASGIGRATVIAMVAAGARVMIGDVDEAGSTRRTSPPSTG